MYRIGIDLGGINIACGLVTEDGKLIAKKSVPTRAKNDTPDGIAKSMVDVSLDVIAENGLKEEDVALIGIGIPGAVDRDRGFIIRTANVPLDGYDLAGFFARYTKIPIRLDNDANCAALGEAIAGAAKGVKTALTVTLGTGVGGGIIIDGRIYSGFNFAGGEMGHMVTHKGGRKCGCGRRGCFETYASATAIIHDTREAFKKHPESAIGKLCGGDPSKITGRTAFDARDLGDETGKAVVDNYIRELGEGIVNYINIFQPEVLLLGGGIANQGEKLLEPLREYVFTYSYGANLLPRTKIMCATLGNDAGIIGAAML
ncbi:MAG: ROK family protein [Clostridia bacterium]|nr:ROK family protein [Clostridia bacterium]MBO7504281.1 ROK family protein [Clostridia bacterium]MBP5767453.1 ROK family protein [Clostridia bacterium]